MITVLRVFAINAWQAPAMAKVPRRAPQPVQALAAVPPRPLVVALLCDAEVAAGHGHVAGDLFAAMVAVAPFLAGTVLGCGNGAATMARLSGRYRLSRPATGSGRRGTGSDTTIEVVVCPNMRNLSSTSSS
jgi:hypothetical protein